MYPTVLNQSINVFILEKRNIAQNDSVREIEISGKGRHDTTERTVKTCERKKNKREKDSVRTFKKRKTRACKNNTSTIMIQQNCHHKEQ